MVRRFAGFFLLVALMAVLGSTGAWADPISVQFQSKDLGGSLWQYDYTVNGDLLANQGVAIYFADPGFANEITDVTTDPADWTTFAFDIDNALPAPGEFDVVANLDHPDLNSMFSVDFTWNGNGAPGSQAFNVYDFNPVPAELLASGNTIPVPTTGTVPEPASLLLLGTGMGCLLKLRKRNRRPS